MIVIRSLLLAIFNSHVLRFNWGKFASHSNLGTTIVLRSNWLTSNFVISLQTFTAIEIFLCQLFITGILNYFGILLNKEVKTLANGF